MSFVVRCCCFLFFACNLVACAKGVIPVDAADSQVNTGYGTVNERDFNGSTSDVKDPLPAINLESHLRKLGGVNIRGQGADAVITIRGGAVSTSYQEPLFVVDGTIIGGGYRVVYDMINPNDIKKIRVLRDGSSTAMYGVRGSAGVILIDLKK